MGHRVEMELCRAARALEDRNLLVRLRRLALVRVRLLWLLQLCSCNLSIDHCFLKCIMLSDAHISPSLFNVEPG
jgi:hypothetical protein